MSHLENYVGQFVMVLTLDGRQIVGVLKGFDQTINIIMDDSYERVYSPRGVQQVPLGLYIVRGDNVAVVGDVDEELDKKINYAALKSEQIPPIVH